MKKLLLAVALAPFALGFSMANAQTEVTTDPVGFVKLDIQPGLQTVGLPMVNPAIAAGKVASNNDTTITMEDAVDGATGGTYYLEVVSGAAEAPWIGDRFDVSSVSGTVVSIDTSSERNTNSLSNVDLSGYSVIIRPHFTLSAAFPPDDMTEGDQVLYFENSTGGYSVISLDANLFSGDLEWTDDLVLAPGMGLFYRSAASAEKSVVNLGEVRMNTFRQPLNAGLNFVSEGHPVDNSPASRLMTEGNGFEANDQVLVFNSSSGGYDIYSLEADLFSGDLEWNVPNESADIFKANSTVFINKISADDDYEAPRPF